MCLSTSRKLAPAPGGLLARSAEAARQDRLGAL